MCVIDQPARALYHHSIGKSDESQPEDTPHQQPPPSAATIIGEEVPKKMNGRLPAPPSPESVRNPDQPQSKSPGINTRTPDAEFTQQADRTPGTTPFRPHHRPIIHRAPERNAKAGPCPIDAADLSSAQPTPSTTVHPSPSKKSHQHERPRTKDHGALSSHADAVCQRTCRSPRHHLQYL